MRNSDTVFKFEDGNVSRYLKLVMLPVKIGQKAVTSFTDATDYELPLLLKQNEMKALKAKIDFINDMRNIHGQDIKT